jgi:redox-sensitive bicupin YhaK (pirin superfamily)
LGDFDKGKTTTYKLNKNGNGIYFFVLNGKVKIADQDLDTRDGFGIWNTPELSITATEKTELLVMEIPMG